MVASSSLFQCLIFFRFVTMVLVCGALFCAHLSVCFSIYLSTYLSAYLSRLSALCFCLSTRLPMDVCVCVCINCVSRRLHLSPKTHCNM